MRLPFFKKAAPTGKEQAANAEKLRAFRSAFSEINRTMQSLPKPAERTTTKPWDSGNDGKR